MVGNLHEWTSAASGTFRGGYYLDTTQHGSGCDYVTTAHNVKYHDYSTGFRCCKGGKRSKPALLAKFLKGSTTARDGGKSSTSKAGSKDRTSSRKRTFGKRPAP